MTDEDVQAAAHAIEMLPEFRERHLPNLLPPYLTAESLAYARAAISALEERRARK